MRPEPHDSDHRFDGAPPSPEAWAERHDGIFTIEIAAAAGLSRQQLSRRRAAGRSRAIRRGVDAIAGPGDDHINVIAPLHRVIRLPGVRAHRSGTIEEGDIITRGGMRLTSPLRAVLDPSGRLTSGELGRLVDHFLRARQLRLEELRARVNRTRPAPGRSIRTLQRVLRDRIPGCDPGESNLEARLAQIIGRAGLPVPTQQHRISYGVDRYRIDFAWPDRKLYLEGNGFGFHRLSSDLDRDAARQNELVLDGWVPIELTWRMTDQFIEQTLRRFLARV